MNASHRHYPGLDTLRAAAILMVIPRHAWEILSGDFTGETLKNIFFNGWVGVDLFFVLSGFLIGSQLLQAAARDGRVDFKRFYIKRSMRILPAYYTVLALYFAWPAFREKPDLVPAWKYVFFLMNFGEKANAFSHAWSLCVEEHFYLVVPLLVAVYVGRKIPLPKPWQVFWGVMIGSIALRYVIFASGAPFYPDLYRPTYVHLDGLTVGVGLALLRHYRRDIWERFTTFPKTLLVTGCLLAGAGMWMLKSGDVLFAAAPAMFSYTLVSFGFGLLLLAAMTPNFWLAQKKIPGVAITANLAFALYLVHKQMIHMAKVMFEQPFAHRLEITLIATLLTMLAASALYWGVERPFLKLRDRMLR